MATRNSKIVNVKNQLEYQLGEIRLEFLRNKAEDKLDGTPFDDDVLDAFQSIEDLIKGTFGTLEEKYSEETGS